MSKIKLCKKCRSKNNPDLFYSGYYSWLNEDCYECPMKDCGGQLVDVNLSKNDFDTIISTSKDINFLEAMIELKEEDIIEYNLKLSQFKSQVGEQKSNSSDNRPKCPTCGSTKLSKVSTISKAGSVALWGLLSQKVKKTWHCSNCGYEW